KFSSLSETEQFLQQSRIYVGFPKESLVENPPQKTLNDAVKELQKICNELGDKQGAIDDYTQAIKINPNLALAYSNRGIVYHQQGNYIAAISEYNQAIAKDANSLAAVNNIGLIKYEQGDKETAIKQWQKAMKIDNKSAEPILALAVALYTKGEQQQAYQLAETALKLDKNFADTNFLKKNLWGDKIIADAQKLLSTLPRKLQQ
ncbi:MAG: tetratricopeptide repeat protein, partial [Dolichospermum sp.]